MQLICNYMTLSIPIKYEYFFDRSLWLLEWTLKGTTIWCQSGSGSYDNEGVSLFPRIWKRASSADTI